MNPSQTEKGIEAAGELDHPSRFSQLDSITNGASQSSTLSGRRRQKLEKSCWVWNHFDTKDGCIVCLECVTNKICTPTTFSLETATINLAFHLKGRHGIEKDSNTMDLTQTALSSQVTLQRHNVMQKETIEKATAALARLILDAKISFKIVEHSTFRAFICTLSRHVPAISRNTFIRAIEDLYSETIPRVKGTLRKVDSSISITCDGWSFRVLRG